MKQDSCIAICKCGYGRFHAPHIGPIQGAALAFVAEHHSGEGHGPATSYREWRLMRDGHYFDSVNSEDFRGVDWDAEREGAPQCQVNREHVR